MPPNTRWWLRWKNTRRKGWIWSRRNTIGVASCGLSGWSSRSEGCTVESRSECEGTCCPRETEECSARPPGDASEAQTHGRRHYGGREPDPGGAEGGGHRPLRASNRRRRDSPNANTYVSTHRRIHPNLGRPTLNTYKIPNANPRDRQQFSQTVGTISNPDPSQKITSPSFSRTIPPPALGPSFPCPIAASP